MRDMADGSYKRALTSTFIPELLSMNLLMVGMVPTAMILRAHIQSANDPTTPRFWFVMSMALLVGFIIACPMNWWLVANHLKHGGAHAPGSGAYGAQSGVGAAANGKPSISMIESGAPRSPVLAMTLLSFLALAAGLTIASVFRPL